MSGIWQNYWARPHLHSTAHLQLKCSSCRQTRQGQPSFTSLSLLASGRHAPSAHLEELGQRRDARTKVVVLHHLVAQPPRHVAQVLLRAEALVGEQHGTVIPAVTDHATHGLVDRAKALLHVPAVRIDTTSQVLSCGNCLHDSSIANCHHSFGFLFPSTVTSMHVAMAKRCAFRPSIELTTARQSSLCLHRRLCCQRAPPHPTAGAAA